jgi:tripartite-type tricarboxylate transporter receptor subunit TctC
VRACAYLGAIFTCAQIPTVAAQTYPSRPIRFIVTTAPGGSPDILARIVAQKVSESFRQQIVVDNRAGASGAIGATIAANSPADGHTLLLATSLNVGAMPALRKKLPYDADKDFAAVTQLAWVANVVGIHPGLPATNVASLVDVAKSRVLNFASAGVGSPAHLAGEMFNVLAGVKMTHIPYKGAGPASADLIAGQVQVFISSPLVLMPYAKTGRLRVLATTGAKRDPLLPELPAVAETLPGYDITQWWGVMVPARTPRAIVDRLAREVAKALALSDVQEKLRQQGTTPLAEGPEAFAHLIAAERIRIARLAERAGLRLDD